MKAMYKLAGGVRDFLPEECYRLNRLKRTLEKTFVSRGFRMVETPVLERYDIYSKGVGYVPAHKLFKLSDADGSLLVLRPDMTMPIARVIHTKMHGVTNAKLCYVADSFRFGEKGNAMREFTQAGVEVIAPGTPFVDADVIALAIRALRDAGLKDFQIDIGHVGFFKALLTELGLNSSDEDELIRLVDAKDAFGLELFKTVRDLNSESFYAILRLPALFGGIEILSEALKYCACAQAKCAIDNLFAVYEGLKLYGYEKYVSFDLSLVNQISYYSGVVFKGITRYYGTSILSGGRYDKLSESFDKQTPATGFAIGVNYLLAALENECGEAEKMPAANIYAGADEEKTQELLQYLDASCSDGMIAENSYAQCEMVFDVLFAQSQAQRGVYFRKDGSVKEVERG